MRLVYLTGKCQALPQFFARLNKSTNMLKKTAPETQDIIVKEGTKKKLKQKNDSKKKRFVCHYCKKPGHIRPVGSKLNLDRAKSKGSGMLIQHNPI